jgi:hypothetical protein
LAILVSTALSDMTESTLLTSTPTVSYSDFVFVGFMHFIHRMVGDEEFKRFEQWPEIMAQYKACSKWFERDSN